MSDIGVNRPSAKLSGDIQRTGNIPVVAKNGFMKKIGNLRPLTFLAESVIVTLKHRSGHPKVSQFYSPARVYQTISASDISMNVFQLC